MNPTTLQFIMDALRTPLVGTAFDLTVDANRRALGTDSDRTVIGRPAIRTNAGATLTIAQIAALSGISSAVVTALAGKI